MIHDTDRRFFIGGSDAHKLLANHDTKTWQKWWLGKLGAEEIEQFDTIYTAAGTRFEHPILERFDPDINMDRQIILPDKMLRINYDGDKDGNIFEVKTHKADKGFEVTPYIEAQVQLQMYVWQESGLEFKNLYILSYGLVQGDYDNMEPTVDDIDFGRIRIKKVKYKKRKVEKLLEALEPLVPELKEAYERSGKDGNSMEHEILQG